MTISSSVSICLPVFNGGRFLVPAIESVLRQTHQDFELLIADDCSTDESLDIIDSFARQDKRISYWRNERNLGLFGNYNECMRRSRGSYVKLFAQDDLLHENCVSRAVEIFDDNPGVGLVANKRGWIDEAGNDISEFVGAPDSSLYVPSSTPVSGREVIRQSLSEVVNFVGEPSAVTVRQVHCQNGFDTLYHHLGDLDFWLTVLRQSDYYYIDERLSSFRLHNDSRTASNIRELLFLPDTIRLARKFEDLLVVFGDSYEQMVRRSARALSDHIKVLLMTGEITPDDFKGDAAARRYRTALSDAHPASQPIEQRLINDLLAFRELAFYALHEAGTSAPVTPVRKANPRRRAREIAALESKLGRLLDSLSWRMTRVLRDCNARTFHTRQTRQWLGAELSLDDPEVYVQYLRAQIKRVKSSRSWKLTHPIRRMGLF